MDPPGPYPKDGWNTSTSSLGSPSSILSTPNTPDDGEKAPSSTSKHVDGGTAALRAALSGERLTESGAQRIAECLSHLESPSIWCLNPRLCYILHRAGCLHMLSKILDAGVSDLWLPLHRRLVCKWLSDADTRTFMRHQDFAFDDSIPTDLGGRHFTLDNLEQLDLSTVKFLGAGGFGEVHHVQDRHSGQACACKTMRRPVKYALHVELMRNFKREVMGMRRVRHQHCVDLVASCTDMDCVDILYSPVADMDLAEFLNADLEAHQFKILQHAIGCITSALAYLHTLKIRHDDLKPNNILIHGDNILLTDFGFCLDSTDTGITTTAGPPAHFTRRYSAPEVFDHAPRNRKTDVWSLGCVLADIVSRLFGHKPDALATFWRSKGSKSESYAENVDATTAWFSVLSQQTSSSRWLWLFSFIRHIVLEADRQKRPTAVQVLARLRATHRSQTPSRDRLWLSACCAQIADQCADRLRPIWAKWKLRPHLPLPFDLLGGRSHFGVVFLDCDLSVLASNVALGPGSGIDGLFGDELEMQRLTDATTALIRNSRFTIGFKRAHQQHPTEDFNVLMKSLYIGCYDFSDMLTTVMRLHFPSEKSRRYTVQLILATLQFESEQVISGLPFITLYFDIDEDEKALEVLGDESFMPSPLSFDRDATNSRSLYYQSRSAASRPTRDIPPSNYEQPLSGEHGFACPAPDCAESSLLFRTSLDYRLHYNHIHHNLMQDALPEAQTWKCAHKDCAHKANQYLTLAVFKKHIEYRHKDFNMLELVERSEVRRRGRGLIQSSSVTSSERGEVSPLSSSSGSYEHSGRAHDYDVSPL